MSDTGAGSVMHASCVAVAGRAVLITGHSGTGKSSLALRIIALGGELVADDQVCLVHENGALVAFPPTRLAGLIECRGLGIARLAHLERAAVTLVADLDAVEVTRMPHLRKTFIKDVCLPLIRGGNRPHLAEELSALLRCGKEPLFMDPEDPLEADVH